MESTARTCEIARLPDDLLSSTLARTAPRDVCRAAAVSPAFRVAADADAVWSSFLPRDLPPLADGELPADPQLTKKQLFMRLSDRFSPVLLADRLTGFWLDRATGAKCYMLCARKLDIDWGDTREYWTRYPPSSFRFSEAAVLEYVYNTWLEIRGKIDSKMLSQHTTYGAYIVIKVAPRFPRFPCVEASVSLQGSYSRSTRRVCLNNGNDLPVTWPEGIPHDGVFPNRDGWTQVELGEFRTGEGDDGEVSIRLKEPSEVTKRLVVLGIEIKPKRQVIS